MHRRSRWVAGLLVLLAVDDRVQRRRRRRRRVVRHDGARPTTATTAATHHHDAPSSQGKPLVVAEQGVSSFPDLADPQATLGGYGVVIENPEPDAHGHRRARRHPRSSTPPGAELLVDSTLLNGILPGQRMAVGRTLIEPIEEPTSLDVKVEVTAWLPPASADGPPGRRGRRHRARGGRRLRHPLQGPVHLARRSRTASTSPPCTAPRTAASSSAESTSLDVPIGEPDRRPHPPALPHPRPRSHRGLRRSGLRRPDHRLTPQEPPMRRPLIALLVRRRPRGGLRRRRAQRRRTTDGQPPTTWRRPTSTTSRSPASPARSPPSSSTEPFELTETDDAAHRGGRRRGDRRRLRRSPSTSCSSTAATARSSSTSYDAEPAAARRSRTR